MPTGQASAGARDPPMPDTIPVSSPTDPTTFPDQSADSASDVQDREVCVRVEILPHCSSSEASSLINCLLAPYSSAALVLNTTVSSSIFCASFGRQSLSMAPNAPNKASEYARIRRIACGPKQIRVRHATKTDTWMRHGASWWLALATHNKRGLLGRNWRLVRWTAGLAGRQVDLQTRLQAANEQGDMERSGFALELIRFVYVICTRHTGTNRLT